MVHSGGLDVFSGAALENMVARASVPNSCLVSAYVREKGKR